MKRVIALALIFSLLVSGCASWPDKTLTGRLWDSDLASNHNGPDVSPNLRVSETADHKDFLVEYNEERDKDAKIEHRAYWLYANEQRIGKGERPRFVDLRLAEPLQAITVETNYAPELTGANPSATVAVLQEDHRHFMLVSDGTDLGMFQLPTYQDPGSRAKVVALTPVTIAGDATFYIGIVAVAAGALVWAGLAYSNTTVR